MGQTEEFEMDKMALADRFEGYSHVFASDSNIGIDLKAMADTLREMPEEKFAKVINADFEEESSVISPMSGPGSMRRVPLSERPGYGGGKKIDPAKAKMIADKYKLTPDQIHEIAVDLESLKGPAPKPSFEEAEAAAKVEAPKAVKDTWTKSASDYIAQNLVRDVLGMDKSICCDTKRHLTPPQMPDAKKKQETKGAVVRQEDTGRALTPEQTPVLSEKLDSDMYKKSKGPVRKEATAASEETPETRAAEPQAVNKDAVKVKDPAKEIEKMKKEKAEEELKARHEQDKKTVGKPADEEVEANTIVAEGIEFDNVMMEADANDEDVKKLSALFE
jgi:hypothetical protein